MDQYHHALNSSALMPLHKRATLDSVAAHFHMSVLILLKTTETFGMRTMGIESHGFQLLWFLASLQAFGGFVVHWLLVISGELLIFDSWTP
jgi:hypothetical protein